MKKINNNISTKEPSPEVLTKESRQEREARFNARMKKFDKALKTRIAKDSHQKKYTTFRNRSLSELTYEINSEMIWRMKQDGYQCDGSQFVTEINFCPYTSHLLYIFFDIDSCRYLGMSQTCRQAYVLEEEINEKNN